MSLRHCTNEGWYVSLLLLRTGFEPSTTQAAHTTILNWLEADGLEEAAAFFSHRPERPNLAPPRICNQGLQSRRVDRVPGHTHRPTDPMSVSRTPLTRIVPLHPLHKLSFRDTHTDRPTRPSFRDTHTEPMSVTQVEFPGLTD